MACICAGVPQGGREPARAEGESAVAGATVARQPGVPDGGPARAAGVPAARVGAPGARHQQERRVPSPGADGPDAVAPGPWGAQRVAHGDRGDTRGGADQASQEPG